ncbi:MAG: hypothetical protein AAF721_12385 [Myxococcota bacterium]
MNRFPLAVVALSLAACGTDKSDEPDDPSVGITATVGLDDGGSADDEGADDTAGGGDNNPDDGPDDDGPDDDGVDPSKFDVGAGGNYFCQFKEAGLYCDGNSEVTCGDNGDVVSSNNCVPDICEEGVGCVQCLPGQTTCMGPNVMTCNAAANPSVWQVSEVCDPAAGMGCDAALGTCSNLVPVGGTEPTGVYFQYADFPTSGVFGGGYDVDSFENKLYINRGTSIEVYEVELLDSDGDGQFEPNQHPLNPDEMGPIEERVLTALPDETISWPTNLGQSVSELYANELGVWAGGLDITEQLFAGGGATTVITTPPAWSGRFSQIGWDEINMVWYASNEQNRRVFQYHAPTDAWGIAFLYPPLAGDHMDGLEVVVQPETGIPFVYVSDMTSDFIGQYRLDPNLGWVQENLFEYDGTAGSLLEGMGFGAFNHFWATSGSSLYEVGGGDLAEFTDPPG